jgi:hypothetical protein
MLASWGEDHSRARTSKAGRRRCFGASPLKLYQGPLAREPLIGSGVEGRERGRA